MSSRHGKHNPDNVILGAIVTPEQKALAVVAADILGETITEIIMNGVRSEATRAGIMENGVIKDNWKEALALAADFIRSKKNSRKANNETK